jgi:tetratricopeptide (TPR) repeat protein
VGALAGFSVWVLFNFDWAPATGMFWLLLGTLWSAVTPPLPAGHGRRVRAVIGAPVAAVLVVVAVLLAVLPLFADTWYLRGRAGLSVRADPLQAQYHWALGTVAALQHAADLGEYDPGMYVQLGDLERGQGDIAGARNAYRRALEIDPYYSPAAQRLADLGS